MEITTVENPSALHSRLRVLCVIGTRPEVIKMAPVVKRLRAEPDRFQVRVLFTGQHRELLRQTADQVSVQADSDLDVMGQNQSLSDLLSRLLLGLDRELIDFAPDVAVAQGDTTSVLATALACHHRRVRFAHVEAGLRTADRGNPFPEEGNRRLTSVLADLHFAPTQAARDALLAENVPAERVFVTGNTVVDALWDALQQPLRLPIALDGERLLAVMTVHRRESFGAPLERIFAAVRCLANRHPDVDFVYPVHPNPNVHSIAFDRLAGLTNVRLIDPVDYHGFIALMARAAVILTDSGGVQEEAPSLGVPIIVLRDTTERPEGVAAGCARLVGSDEGLIIEATSEVIDARRAGLRHTMKRNPYGDGHAAKRILEAVDSLCRSGEVHTFDFVA